MATWVIRSKQALRDGEANPFPTCKHRQVGVESDVVDGILMPEQRYFSCDEEPSCMGRVFTPLQRLLDGCLHALSSRLTHWTKPLGTALSLGTLADLGKSQSQLIAENALLRQQLVVLRRQVK